MILTHSILVVDYDVDIEQRPHQQSSEWHHSIIDWVSQEAFLLVRQSLSISRHSKPVA